MLHARILSLVLGFMASPALADIKQVDFAEFPNGTKCNATGAKGTVKVREKRNEIQVLIKGDASGARFFCDLPDGRKVEAILPKLPKGAVADLQTWSDGTGKLIMSVNGSFALQDVPKALKWLK